MIEQAKELMALGWNGMRLFPAGHETTDVYDPRVSHRRRPRDGA